MYTTTIIFTLQRTGTVSRQIRIPKLFLCVWFVVEVFEDVGLRFGGLSDAEGSTIVP